MDIKKLARQFENCIKVDDSLQSAKHLLTWTARRYAHLSAEHERIKSLIGIGGSFRFLDLPRELRNIIYRYALHRHSHVGTWPRPSWSNPSYVFETYPDTPGLLGVNKQVHREAREVLYGSNLFLFIAAKHLVEFEKQIGKDNRGLVRNVRIQMGSDEDERESYILGTEEFENLYFNWAAAMKWSSFTHLEHITIAMNDVYGDSRHLFRVPRTLRMGIEALVTPSEARAKPRIVLQGFKREQRAKLPQGWDVVMEPHGEWW